MDIDTLQALHNIEMGYVSPSERRWLNWCKQVEDILGHDLDGNQETDGYSIDYAYEAFKKGRSPRQYVSSI